MRPSSWLVRLFSLGLVFSLLPILFAHTLWPLVVGMWALLLGGALLDGVALANRRARLDVQQPAQAYVGEPIAFRFTLHWPKKRRLRARWWAETQAPLEQGEAVTRWIESEETQFSIDLIAPRRGEGQLLALWAEIRGPLGLFERVQRFALDLSPLPILPSLPYVRRLALQHFGLWQYREGIRIERLPGDGSEFDALEKYSPGHDLRSIDWKASARHQSLLVRRFRVERNQRVVFCLDTGHLMADDLQGMQRLDHAIHTSLLLGHFALRAGDLVGLHSYAEAPKSWLPPKNGIKNFHRMHLACAALRSTAIETNHVRGLHHLLAQLNRRTLIVLFTEFTGTTTAELMLETVGHLVQKHLVIFVALEDPALDRPLEKKPEDAEDMARALVSVDMRQERQAVLLRLQRMGVHVVQGSVDISAAKLVQRYLEIKRRQLLG